VWGMLGYHGWDTIQSLLWQSLPSLGITYLLLAMIYGVAPGLWKWLLKAHRWLAMHSFQEAINHARLPLGPIIVTNLFVNFSFLTLVSVLPFRELLVGTIPLLKPAELLIPPTLQDLLSSPSILLLYIVAVFPGPSLVFVVRLMRQDQSDVGGRIFEFLQILFYASTFLAVYVGGTGSTFSGIPFYIYIRLITIVLLPGNVGGAGFMMLLLASQRKRGLSYSV